MLDQKMIDEKEFLKLKQQILSDQVRKSPQSNLNHNDQLEDFQSTHSTPASPIIQYQGGKSLKMVVLAVTLIMAVGLIFLYYSRTIDRTPDSKFLVENYPSDDDMISSEYVFHPLNDYPKPQQLVYPFPGTNENKLFAECYPIGWSKEGKLAYMMVPVNEAGEPCHISFYIIDLITDQIVYTALSSNYADHADHRFDQAWREMHNELIPILNQYQIEPNRGVQLLATPYLDKRSGNQYDFHIWNRIGEHVSLPLKVSTAAAIHVKKNGVIDKNRWILREKYDNSGPICNKVVGYLKSPFENRLAVLYVTEFLGYEGPPNVINFEWVGCLID